MRHREHLFPGAAIQEAAIRSSRTCGRRRGKTAADSGAGSREKKDKTSRLELFRFIGLGPSVANAAVDVNVSTPAIRGLKSSWPPLPQLQPLYSKGAIGETNNGYVATRNTGALSLRSGPI